jgi:glycosyltransferase involved in cell wall biosynthesis
MNFDVSPSVTVAIIFYNSLPHFRASVASVLCQSFTDFELLLIDDGSSDGSLEFARSISDNRVRVVSDGKNLKLNIRLNQSVEMARGRFYCRMDSDDVMFPDRIRTQLDFLGSCCDEVKVVGSWAISITPEGEVRGWRKTRARCKSAYQARNCFIHPTVFGYTNWFKENRYSESFVYHRSQDAELWVRTFSQHCFATLEEPLVFYRESGVVNVDNYVGTALGLISIGYKSPFVPRGMRVFWITYEIFKVWLIVLISLFGRTGVLVKWRGSGMKLAERVKYIRILSRDCGLIR